MGSSRSEAGVHPVEDASGFRGWADQLHTPATESAVAAAPGIALPDPTKHAAGDPLRQSMDWIDLPVGPEGALAGMLEAEVRLLPAPETRLRKAHLLELQYTPAELEAMKEVKGRLDPHWLLGRGTLFPPPEERL